jgi:pimeloyl-ACP methyl ester carboxylesterase
MGKPTILFVPGLWEGPSVFTTVIHSLHTLSYPTQTISLPSTGSNSPGNPTMRDDEATVRSVLQKLIVEEEKDVMMVMHSAGGFLGSAATEGLDRKKREKEGKRGGVVRCVFLCAGVAEVGYFHADMPFMDLEVS